MISKRTKGKIPAGYGITDYYKAYSDENENAVSSQLFNKVITEFNKAVVDAIIEKGLAYTPKYLQMNLCIRKTKKVPKIKDGKLVNTMPVNYKETLALWRTNEEARENKILIRHLNNRTDRYVFRIKMIDVGFRYANKQYYKFKPCRSFQRTLAHRILDDDKDNFDAFALY